MQFERGETVYYLQRSLSRSGMTSTWSFYVVRDGQIVDVSREVAAVVNLPVRNGTVVARGSGVDLGYMRVTDTARVIFHDDQALRPQRLY